MKVAVIGAGASGLMFAAQFSLIAKEQGQSVCIDIFEQNERVGKKLLSTGNGRCNLTNLNTDGRFYPACYGFAGYALEKFSPESNIVFFNSIGLYCRSDSEGRVYPMSNNASSVLDALRFACERLGVRFLCSTRCESIKPHCGGFLVNSSFYNNVVLCCGSRAAVREFYGYELLRSLGHGVTPVSPSIVKMKTADKRTKQLKGIRAAASITLIKDGKPLASEKGELQFGDGTISGIAAMQLSSFAARHFIKSRKPLSVSVDFIPDMQFTALCDALYDICGKNAGLKTENLLSGFMPKKIGEIIIKSMGLSLSGDISNIGRAEIKKLASKCKGFNFEISGLADFSAAQVTAGGADTSEFDRFTLESKKHKGLYCCGELLDVDGLCGGYNLQWAWSSARLCAYSIFRSALNDKNK